MNYPTRHFPVRPPSAKPAQPGFALVVTLSLMILLTVIAVGLLSLSSISLRASNRGEAMATARANARLALIMALGDLQKTAGPDQRITAPADIAGTSEGLRLDAGQAPGNGNTVTNASKGLSAVRPGTRYWTGVFDNQETGTPQTTIFSLTPAPRHVQWLVSGDSITPADGLCEVKPDGTVADAKRAAVLVGKYTAGAGADGQDRYVAAPLVPVMDTRSSKNGRFAWWVGDEGVKARINLSRTREDSGDYAALVAQRRGWETVSGLQDYPIPGTATHAKLPLAISFEQTKLLPGVGSSAQLPEAFHSATADSLGLLTDTLSGGTRMDLSAILAAPLPTAKPPNAPDSYPLAGARIIPASAAPNMRAPRWDVVKAFHDRHATLQSGALKVRAASNLFEASVAPLLTDIRLLMGARILPPPSGASETATQFRVHPCGKIAIAIANPYTVPLEWDNHLEITIINQTPTGNTPSRIWPIGGTNAPAYLPSVDRPNEDAVFHNLVFRIRPSRLGPGEARAYTQAASVVRPVGSGGSRVVADLVEFTKTAPFDFKISVELENNTLRNPPINLDVREQWQTTLAMVEMKLAGSSSSAQPLRRVERFELDNGYFSPTQRKLPLQLCREFSERSSGPFPLTLFSFQISRPGTNYLSLMPAGYDWGQRGSTLRTFADFNLAATRIIKPIASYNPPPYFVENNDSPSQLPFLPPGGDTGMAFTRNLVADPMPWGRDLSGPPKTVLFSIPPKLVSLAQLQHADLTGDDTQASVGHQPGNAFANSYASPFVKREVVVQRRTDYELIGNPNKSGTKQTARNYYDISHLLNSAIWDSFFLSSIPASSAEAAPENPTLIRLPAASASDLKDPLRSAGGLMIDGAFNINSTDKNAWKAFLGSTRHLKHLADSNSGDSTQAAFPRSLEQPDSAAIPPTGTQADSFSGFRRLSDAELDALAGEITKQVRLRGPFLSLSHFVNRALATLENQAELTRSGALQTAIDASGINISPDGRKKALTGINPNLDKCNLSEKNGAPRADMDGGATANRPASAGSDPDWATASTDQNYGSVASIIADRSLLSSRKAEQGYRSTGIPGWLTQADVLQAIGPAISARSDTFRIRACGEALDAQGNVIATAYCEAIVQRMPAYIDPANPPEARVADLSPLNRTYGRQFQIITFRWLSSNEI